MLEERTMTVISRRLPPVLVEYDANGGRRVRYFENLAAARYFYCQKDKAGKRPRVRRTPKRTPG